MRGTKAKRLRKESETGQTTQDVEATKSGIKQVLDHKRAEADAPRPLRREAEIPGKPRRIRREERFHPIRHELAMQGADPAARRNHARRWNFIYSKAARKAAEAITRKKEPEWTDPGQEPS